MFYDRNNGVKSILNARINGDVSELRFKGSAMFNITDGKITHNTEYIIGRDRRWRFFTSYTYPVFENNQFVGYFGCGDWHPVGNAD